MQVWLSESYPIPPRVITEKPPCIFQQSGFAFYFLLFVPGGKVHHVAQLLALEEGREVVRRDVDDALKGLRQMEAA